MIIQTMIGSEGDYVALLNVVGLFRGKLNEITEWCTETFDGEDDVYGTWYTYNYNPWARAFVFRHEADRTLFILRWNQ